MAGPFLFFFFAWGLSTFGWDLSWFFFWLGHFLFLAGARSIFGWDISIFRQSLRKDFNIFDGLKDFKDLKGFTILTVYRELQDHGL